VRFGTQLVRDDAGRPVRVERRGGPETILEAGLWWVGEDLARVVVGGLHIEGPLVRDTLLGDAHQLFVPRMPLGEPLTAMSALDWRDPRQIPTIANPARLPSGSGAQLMNLIAHLSTRPLRYAGPYPTPALFRTLSRSFTTSATEDEFCADVMGRAARVARDEIAIDFTPAPHERIAFSRGHVELRERLERAVIDGVSYDSGVARLVDGHAEIWFGDAPYARVASFATDGTLLGDVAEIPACASPVIGKPFPPALCGALAELVAEAVPAPIATDVAALVAETPMAWTDLRSRAARFVDGRFELHAALWDRIAPHGLARLALALAEALAPIAMSVVLARVSSPG
jgi:hypothetical protein